MDLVETIRRKIEALDEGDYIFGLRAVLLHIETAFAHLSRGQSVSEDTAFTDAVYRTNQAFEGSIKEAYRVIAERDPENKRPYDIENYLDENDVFRSRVLDQLKNYRKHWRNPSTHDYKLDFDESEAFLAIVSVSAFAVLLLDQITEHIAFKTSQAETEAQLPELRAKIAAASGEKLIDRLTHLLVEFGTFEIPSTLFGSGLSEALTIGQLHGFLTTAAPEVTVEVEAPLGDAKGLYWADLLVSDNDDSVIVEIKRQGKYSESHRLKANAVAQVEKYLQVSGKKYGVLLLLPRMPSKMKFEELCASGTGGRIIVISPDKGA